MQDLRSFCRTPDQAGPGGDRNVGIFFLLSVMGVSFYFIISQFFARRGR